MPLATCPEAEREYGHETDEDLARRVSLPFADEALGLRFSPGELTAIGAAAARRERDAGPVSPGQLARAAERAIRREIPARHRGLPYALVKVCRAAYPFTGIDDADLVQEGNFGLIRAAEKFDLSRGFRFSTYARPWCLRFMGNAILLSSTHLIHVPLHVHAMMARRAHGEALSDHDREFVAHMDDLRGRALYRDGKWHRASDFRFEDIVERGGSAPAATAEIGRTPLQVLLDSLPDHYREVITAYYGIGTKGRLIREIAAERGTSRQNVQQILEKSRRRLRFEAMKRGWDYLDCKSA